MSLSPLKSTRAFHNVYRRGRWVRGTLLSVGIVAGEPGLTHIGLRTRRGMKGASVRNRLKRQLRAIAYHPQQLRLKSGIDVVIVIHPPTLPAKTDQLCMELQTLCKRLGAHA